MKVLTLALSVIATCALAVPAAAGVETLHDPDADFGSYATYEWMKSNSIAEIPEIRDYLIRQIQAKLQAAGLKLVETGGDLKVGLRVAEKDASSTTRDYNVSPNWTYAYGWSDERAVTKDMLIVDVVDVTANKAVWQGFATEKISGEDRTYYGRLRNKIDKIVSKMFSDFPPKPEK